MDYKHHYTHFHGGMHFLQLLKSSLSCLFSQIREGSGEFFPLLRALALGKEEDETAIQLQQLSKMVKDVLDKFKEEVKHSRTDTHTTYA